VLFINNKSKHTVELKEMKFEWGKFHAFGNKDVEIALIYQFKGKVKELYRRVEGRMLLQGPRGSST
jgi:hypothetical protein